MESPCVDICTMDQASGLCVGCGRTLDEIAGWSRLGDAERRRIMSGLARRLDAAGLTRPAPPQPKER
ncbi:MAG: DUF1289 domain-containing protein [Hyphomicrobiaceae bacterium]|nr:DUF1289 domain-containing protein [Hyphomicrobiaceae bacterium]